jgi:hypothetical protein
MALKNALRSREAATATAPSSPAPALPPPPPPPQPSPPSSSRPHASSLRTTNLDPSAYTLSPNGASSSTPNLASASALSLRAASPSDHDRLWVEDDRWQFKDESQFPKPRTFEGGARRYRAGRGSSVPLDLGMFDRR